MIIKNILRTVFRRPSGSDLPDYRNGEGDRPYYGYCILKASQLAVNLGHKKMSIIEFGVAGGAGLLSIEKNCRLLKKHIDIDFEVYGFDMESGLPEPLDYRDEPYKWSKGFYKMDKEKLVRNLDFSNLVIGDVENTVKTFFSLHDPAPIGCIVFDLDLYSSTKAALKIFDGNEKYFLPRIMCYFDDVGSIEYIGERLAIEEFNDEHDSKKIGQSLKLKFNLNVRGNYIFEYHNFKHFDYNSKAELKKITNLAID